MAVHVIQNQNSWQSALGNLLSQYIGGSIQRGLNAQEYELGQRAENDALTRRQAEQAANDQRLLDYTSGRGWDPMNPSSFTGDVLGYASLNPTIAPQIAEILSQTAPQSSPVQVDLGDRMGIGSFNPRTGIEDLAQYGIGVNPTQQYTSDNILTGQQYTSDNALAGQRYVADQNLAGQRAIANGNVAAAQARGPIGGRGAQPVQNQQVVDEQGNVFYVDPQTGQTYPTGLNVGQQQQQQQINPDLIKSLFGLETTSVTGNQLPGLEWVPGAQQEAIDIALNPFRPQQEAQQVQPTAITQDEYSQLLELGYTPEQIQAEGYFVQ